MGDNDLVSKLIIEGVEEATAKVKTLGDALNDTFSKAKATMPSGPGDTQEEAVRAGRERINAHMTSGGSGGPTPPDMKSPWVSVAHFLESMKKPGDPKKEPDDSGGGGESFNWLHTLRTAIHALRPAASEAGISLGELTPLMYAARGGIAAFGAAVVGTLVVALEKAGDAAKDAGARIGGITGSSEQGTKQYGELRKTAGDIGTSISQVAPVYEEVLRLNQKQQPENQLSTEKLMALVATAMKGGEASRMTPEASAAAFTKFITALASNPEQAVLDLLNDSPALGAIVQSHVMKLSPPGSTHTLTAAEGLQAVSDSEAEVDKKLKGSDVRGISHSWGKVVSGFEQQRDDVKSPGIIASILDSISNEWKNAAERKKKAVHEPIDPRFTQSMFGSEGIFGPKGLDIGFGPAVGAKQGSIDKSIWGDKEAIERGKAQTPTPPVSGPQDHEVGATASGAATGVTDLKGAVEGLGTASKDAAPKVKTAAELQQEIKDKDPRTILGEESKRISMKRAEYDAAYAEQETIEQNYRIDKKTRDAGYAIESAKMAHEEAEKGKELAAISAQEVGLKIVDAKKNLALAHLAVPQAELALASAQTNATSARVTYAKWQEAHGENSGYSPGELEQMEYRAKRQSMQQAIRAADLAEEKAAIEEKYAPQTEKRAKMEAEKADIEYRHADLIPKKAQFEVDKTQRDIESAEWEKKSADLKLVHDKGLAGLNTESKQLAYAQETLNYTKLLSDNGHKQNEAVTSKLDEVIAAIKGQEFKVKDKESVSKEPSISPALSPATSSSDTTSSFKPDSLESKFRYVPGMEPPGYKKPSQFESSIKENYVPGMGPTNTSDSDKTATAVKSIEAPIVSALKSVESAIRDDKNKDKDKDKDKGDKDAKNKENYRVPNDSAGWSNSYGNDGSMPASWKPGEGSGNDFRLSSNIDDRRPGKQKDYSEGSAGEVDIANADSPLSRQAGSEDLEPHRPPIKSTSVPSSSSTSTPSIPFDNTTPNSIPSSTDTSIKQNYVPGMGPSSSASSSTSPSPSLSSPGSQSFSPVSSPSPSSSLSSPGPQSSLQEQLGSEASVEPASLVTSTPSAIGSGREIVADKAKGEKLGEYRTTPRGDYSSVYKETPDNKDITSISGRDLAKKVLGEENLQPYNQDLEVARRLYPSGNMRSETGDGFSGKREYTFRPLSEKNLLEERDKHVGGSSEYASWNRALKDFSDHAEGKRESTTVEQASGYRIDKLPSGKERFYGNWRLDGYDRWGTEKLGSVSERRGYERTDAQDRGEKPPVETASDVLHDYVRNAPESYYRIGPGSMGPKYGPEETPKDKKDWAKYEKGLPKLEEETRKERFAATQNFEKTGKFGNKFLDAPPAPVADSWGPKPPLQPGLDLSAGTTSESSAVPTTPEPAPVAETPSIPQDTSFAAGEHVPLPKARWNAKNKNVERGLTGKLPDPSLLPPQPPEPPPIEYPDGKKPFYSGEVDLSKGSVSAGEPSLPHVRGTHYPESAELPEPGHYGKSVYWAGKHYKTYVSEKGSPPELEDVEDVGKRQFTISLGDREIDPGTGKRVPWEENKKRLYDPTATYDPDPYNRKPGDPPPHPKGSPLPLPPRPPEIERPEGPFNPTYGKMGKGGSWESLGDPYNAEPKRSVSYPEGTDLPEPGHYGKSVYWKGTQYKVYSPGTGSAPELVPVEQGGRQFDVLMGNRNTDSAGHRVPWRKPILYDPNATYDPIPDKYDPYKSPPPEQPYDNGIAYQNKPGNEGKRIENVSEPPSASFSGAPAPAPKAHHRRKRDDEEGYAEGGFVKLLNALKPKEPPKDEADEKTPPPPIPKSTLAWLKDTILGEDRAGGGAIRGPGTGTSDSIPAMLSHGEYVQRASAVQHYGTDFMDSINSMKLPKFSLGGFVSNLSDSLSPRLPHFAAGGRVDTGASGPVAHYSVDLRTDKGNFEMSAPEATVKQLARHAVNSKLTSTGNKPSWYGS